jgi:hypothetical protein
MPTYALMKSDWAEAPSLTLLLSCRLKNAKWCSCRPQVDTSWLTRLAFVPPSHLPLTRSRQHSTVAVVGLAAKLGLEGGKVRGSANAEAASGSDASRTISSSQLQSPYHELSKRSREGHRAWSLDGKLLPNHRLHGSVWNAHAEPSENGGAKVCHGSGVMVALRAA